MGHLLMGQLALEQSGADEVWFVPAPAPPHKLGAVHSDYKIRVDMTRELIDGFPGLTVKELEISLPQPSYTVDTLRYCIKMYPGVQFLFLLGTDSLAQLPDWHEAEVLAEIAEFLVAVRTGHDYAPTAASTRQILPGLQSTVLEMPIIDVSSTWIRERMQEGKTLCGLVPDTVVEQWLAHHHG